MSGSPLDDTEQLIEHIRNGGDPAPGDDAAAAVALLRDEANPPEK